MLWFFQSASRTTLVSFKWVPFAGYPSHQHQPKVEKWQNSFNQKPIVSHFHCHLYRRSLVEGLTLHYHLYQRVASTNGPCIIMLLHNRCDIPASKSGKAFDIYFTDIESLTFSFLFPTYLTNNAPTYR